MQNPNARTPDPRKTSVFISPQPDMTPAEAVALTLSVLLSTKGLTPPKYQEYNFCFDQKEVEKLFDLSIRHWAPREKSEESPAMERASSEPDTSVHIDEAGKKHYTLNAGLGLYGVAGKGF